MMNEKHAYLLLIYQNTDVLDKTLMLIDDERNDIYIHVDKKTKTFNQYHIKELVKKSKVYFIKRRKVYWGTNSITYAEIELLKNATKNHYMYYHFMSGADMPVKSQNYIHQFFLDNRGKQFIHFGTEEYQKGIQTRYNQYHFFTKQLGRKRDKKLWCDLETYSLAIQRRLNINPIKNCKYQFFGGSNWCSITDDFANYIVYNFRKYKRYFRFSQISDEMIWQTIIINSPFKDQLFKNGLTNDYGACVRLIDWDRGTPYVWHKKDFNELMSSQCLFARKFDENIDYEIVEMIYKRLK